MIDLEKVDCSICKSSKSKNLFIKEGFHVVQCLQCGLMYVNPRIDQSKVHELYDKNYFSYCGYMDQHSGMVSQQTVLEKIKNVEQSYLFQELQKLKPGGRVLEIGCAEGSF